MRRWLPYPPRAQKTARTEGRERLNPPIRRQTRIETGLAGDEPPRIDIVAPNDRGKRTQTRLIRSRFDDGAEVGGTGADAA